MNGGIEADLFIWREDILEFVGKAEIYFTYQMKTVYFSLQLYVILESTSHQVGISYLHNFWGGEGGEGLEINWVCGYYIIYMDFFNVIHSALEVTSFLL